MKTCKVWWSEKAHVSKLKEKTSVRFYRAWRRMPERRKRPSSKIDTLCVVLDWILSERKVAGESANAVPHTQKLRRRVHPIWVNRRGQPNRSAMERPRPRGAAFVITAPPRPGKYAEFSARCDSGRRQRHIQTIISTNGRAILPSSTIHEMPVLGHATQYQMAYTFTSAEKLFKNNKIEDYQCRFYQSTRHCDHATYSYRRELPSCSVN